MLLSVESLSKHEVLRFLNADAGLTLPPSMDALIDRCIELTLETIHPVGIYHPFRVIRTENGLKLADTPFILPGKSIAAFFSEVRDTIYAMAVTVGPAMDRLIRTKMITAAEEGVILDTCGAVAAEAAADRLESEIRGAVSDQGKFLTDRYSPGYGDLPLELQPQLLTLLDTSRRIGLMVTGSVLMTPSKSVTAVLGVTDAPPSAAYNRCDDCKLRFHCALRKAGKTCWKTRTESFS